MLSLQSHLSVLQTAASQFSERPAFKIARGSKDGSVDIWEAITYRQFLADVENAARFWSKKLGALGLSRGTVVGLWLAGMDYSDVVIIYGMTRAGFVPQLFSLRLPSPTVVYELLGKACAQALVYDPNFRETVVDPPVPAFCTPTMDDFAACSEEPLPIFPTPVSGEELVFIFHTSGSTSGSPKLVPCNARYVDSVVFKSYQTSKPSNPLRQDVSTWMGSMCHIAQSFMLVGSIQHGSCTIQPSVISFSSEELVDMISRCGLNRLHQFATFLSVHLRHARLNPKLLAHMRTLEAVLFAGLPLPQEDEDYAYKSGLRLVNLFGSTECGAMLISQAKGGREGRFLHALEGVNYEFVYAGPSGQQVSANSKLLELVILESSPDCPHYSLRKEDGHFHTGDLFLEVQPGQYLFRGRDDDWIKSLNSLRCDTRSIEENVRATCKDLVDECIVVGTGRPSPALFVEPAKDMDHEQLKLEIIRRTRAFHSRRYLHERITDPELVIVVEPKTLPRTVTKGNIRRKAVEEEFKELLDELFDVE